MFNFLKSLFSPSEVSTTATTTVTPNHYNRDMNITIKYGDEEELGTLFIDKQLSAFLAENSEYHQDLFDEEDGKYEAFMQFINGKCKNKISKIENEEVGAVVLSIVPSFSCEVEREDGEVSVIDIQIKHFEIKINGSKLCNVEIDGWLDDDEISEAIIDSLEDGDSRKQAKIDATVDVLVYKNKNKIGLIYTQ